MKPKQRLGAFGERIAVERLVAEGFAIVARNARVASGEVDIVATDGDDLVFVEVRTRRASPGTAAESVLAAKLGRMWRCAMDYCETAALDPDRVRLDLVAVDLDESGLLRALEHFRGLEVPATEG